MSAGSYPFSPLNGDLDVERDASILHTVLIGLSPGAVSRNRYVASSQAGYVAPQPVPDTEASNGSWGPAASSAACPSRKLAFADTVRRFSP